VKAYTGITQEGLICFIYSLALRTVCFHHSKYKASKSKRCQTVGIYTVLDGLFYRIADP